ncbi:MAG: tRNA (adenosine(37)-N6)-threonylcarbamoyltransferase complex dimerization subunit type 1 TsaB [Burkholderiales bacterium]
MPMLKSMSPILAIETSSELASAALLFENRVLVRESSGVHTHSQAILPLVQSLLAEADISLAQCDAIAFGCGPGSFTGVRTACGIAQGLAFGLGRPVVPVVTLLAMAQACRAVSGATDVLAVLDARMGEVYWAQYRYADGWQTVIGPTLSAPAAVAPQGDVIACGNGFQVYAAAFEQAGFSVDAWSHIMPHAEQVAQLARIAFSQGLTVPARDAQPLYLRNKVALTTAERKLKAEAAA